MENVNDKRLSFGQRNWFILCILVAIVSPILVHFLQIGARKVSYKQSVDTRYSDTSNKIASPPQTASSSTAKPVTDTAVKTGSPARDSSKK